MIVFKYIILKVLKLLITERTSMMAIDCLFDTGLTIYMSASRYVTVVDRVETDCTLKLLLQFLRTDLEVNMVLRLFDDHGFLVR